MCNTHAQFAVINLVLLFDFQAHIKYFNEFGWIGTQSVQAMIICAEKFQK